LRLSLRPTLAIEFLWVVEAEIGVTIERPKRPHLLAPTFALALPAVPTGIAHRGAAAGAGAQARERLKAVSRLDLWGHFGFPYQWVMGQLTSQSLKKEKKMS
jgi:hypothetical protein